MKDLLNKHGIPADKLIWFDTENFEQENQYATIVDRMISISEGNFNPDKIALKSYYDFSFQSVVYLTELRLDFKDTTYILKMLCEGWFDESLITSVNRILSDQKIRPRKFHLISGADQHAFIGFMDQQHAQSLQKKISEDTTYYLPKPSYFVSLLKTSKA